MTINASIRQPRPEAEWTGKWREQTGEQRMRVRARHASHDLTFSVVYENRWGHELGDTRNISMRLTREGATALRDALTAALDWDGAALHGAPTEEETP